MTITVSQIFDLLYFLSQSLLLFAGVYREFLGVSFSKLSDNLNAMSFHVCHLYPFIQCKSIFFYNLFTSARSLIQGFTSCCCFCCVGFFCFLVFFWMKPQLLSKQLLIYSKNLTFTISPDMSYPQLYPTWCHVHQNISCCFWRKELSCPCRQTRITFCELHGKGKVWTTT